MADEAVSNSGPLIHLAQINRFNLLRVFSRIFIPKAVYDIYNVSNLFVARAIIESVIEEIEKY